MATTVLRLRERRGDDASQRFSSPESKESMKITIYTSLACIVLAAFCASAQTLPKPSASAKAATAGPATMPASQTAATASVSPSGKADRAIPFHGVISKVDAKARSFTLGGKEKSRTFKITDKTVITKNGQPATVKDVSANDDARGSYWTMPDGSMEVKTLKVGAAAEKPKANSEKKASPSATPSSSASAQ